MTESSNVEKARLLRQLADELDPPGEPPAEPEPELDVFTDQAGVKWRRKGDWLKRDVGGGWMLSLPWDDPAIVAVRELAVAELLAELRARPMADLADGHDELVNVLLADGMAAARGSRREYDADAGRVGWWSDEDWSRVVAALAPRGTDR